MNKIWFAAVCAVLVQPLVLAARMAPVLWGSSSPIYGLGLLVLAVLAVSAAFVLLLGIPAFLFLRRKGRANWISLALAGFLIGAIPTAAISWPRYMEGYSSSYGSRDGPVDFYVNGVPTIHAWQNYAESIGYFGLHGLVGALVFFAVWRRRDAA